MPEDIEAEEAIDRHGDARADGSVHVELNVCDELDHESDRVMR